MTPVRPNMALVRAVILEKHPYTDGRPGDICWRLEVQSVDEVEGLPSHVVCGTNELLVFARSELDACCSVGQSICGRVIYLGDERGGQFVLRDLAEAD